MSTLTEVRNRADLIIMVGSDVQKFNPRFFERVVAPPDSMFDLKPAENARSCFWARRRTCPIKDPVGEIITPRLATAEAVGRALIRVSAPGFAAFRVKDFDIHRHHACRCRSSRRALPQCGIWRVRLGAARP